MIAVIRRRRRGDLGRGVAATVTTRAAVAPLAAADFAAAAAAAPAARAAMVAVADGVDSGPRSAGTGLPEGFDARASRIQSPPPLTCVSRMSPARASGCVRAPASGHVPDCSRQ